MKGKWKENRGFLVILLALGYVLIEIDSLADPTSGLGNFLFSAKAFHDLRTHNLPYHVACDT